MIHQNKILAIIPARGGSKRLPKKNIMNLNNKPLIAWTIEAAQKSKYIDEVILSSDDMEICEIARNYNCQVPFIRPLDLANDTASSVSVVCHAINHYGSTFNTIILLQPTSPLRTQYHIDEAIEQFYQEKALTLTSVCPLDKKPHLIFTLNPKKQITPLLQSTKDIENVYFLNGAIYIIDKNNFLATQTFIDEQTSAYTMDFKSSIDIDTKEDFILAQKILKQKMKNFFNSQEQN